MDITILCLVAINPNTYGDKHAMPFNYYSTILLFNLQ